MMQIEDLKTAFQSLCNISAEDTIVPAEILSKVLDVCTENKVLRSKIEELKNFSETLISHLETASRESERMTLLSQQISDLLDRNTNLEGNIRQKDLSITDLRKQLTDKELMIQKLTSQISLKESELNGLHKDCNNLESIRQNYDALNILPYYEKLSDKVKDSLSNIFPNVNTTALLSSGIQENNISLLYDFVVERDIVGTDYNELVIISRKLFEIYNLGRKEPYTIIDPSPGVKIDSNEHIIKGNANYGTISKVIFFGYKTAKGDVKKKAFVEVS